MPSLVRRSLETLAFVAVAYFLATVKIGRRTGWGHIKAIFSTTAAQQAGHDVEKSALGWMRR